MLMVIAGGRLPPPAPRVGLVFGRGPSDRSKSKTALRKVRYLIPTLSLPLPMPLASMYLQHLDALSLVLQAALAAAAATPTVAAVFAAAVTAAAVTTAAAAFTPTTTAP